MVTFVTICGALFTIAFFLYALSAVDNKSIDQKEKERLNKEKNIRSGDPKKVYGKDWDPSLPKLRLCPVCGTVLRKDEFLYAAISSFTNSEGKKQAQIYGCKYCYLITSSNPYESLGPPEAQKEL